MMFLQGLLSLFFRMPRMEKEILIDQNVALASIIEGGLIVLALMVSVAFYSY